jgi:hypothetical protein
MRVRYLGSKVDGERAGKTWLTIGCEYVVLAINQETARGLSFLVLADGDSD